MHGAIILCITIPIYISIAYLVTQIAIAEPYYHDTLSLYSDYAVYTIPVILILSEIAMVLTKPNYDILCKRLTLMLVLKAIAQVLTISPQPDGVEECKGVPIWHLKACADMLFSGHTAFIYLILYKCKWRNFVTFVMAFELVMSNWHYSVDCFMAVIVAYAIEKRIIIESYL